MSDTRTARIRVLNDRLRQTGQGGTVLCTSGIEALGEARMREVILGVQCFDDFSQNNDPYGEHDMGSVKLAGRTIFWKIDLYEDPDVKTADGSPAIKRVMTIMLASEY